MSMMESEIQWFIARDGRQHGPVSDLEMRKLVELGHLRPNDLLWRQGFPDWRPAPAVFASQPPVPLGRTQQPPLSSMQPRTRPPSQGAAPRFDSGPAPHSIGAPQGTRPGVAAGIGRADPVTSGRRPGQPMPEPKFQVPEKVPTHGDGYDDEPSGRGRRIVTALLVVGLLGGGGWYASRNVDQLKSLVQRALPAGVVEAKSDMAAAERAATAEVTTGATTPAPDSSIADLDRRLQQTAHWTLVREEFGDWYQDRVKEAARMTAENKPESEVATYLTQGLVDLRRAHADKALAGSSVALKGMASAFLANIGRLSQESTDACMAFILKGEASPQVVQIVADPQRNAEINAHFAAIFSAVGEGMRQPAKHDEPTEADYQLLVAQLTKLGWTPADLQLFADPKGPTKTTPDRYCTMMHQFFAAHLAVEDPAAQERLLYRTLKLVVAG